jgi:hypothetical protein
VNLAPTATIILSKFWISIWDLLRIHQSVLDDKKWFFPDPYRKSQMPIGKKFDLRGCGLFAIFQSFVLDLLFWKERENLRITNLQKLENWK